MYENLQEGEIVFQEYSGWVSWSFGFVIAFLEVDIVLTASMYQAGEGRQWGARVELPNGGDGKNRTRTGRFLA